MREYDPNASLDPEQWNSLDEDEKLALVQQYHERFDSDVPDVNLHSLVHTIVENQIALGHEFPVAATVARLEREGLDRHDAIHAIASILVDHLHEISSGSHTKDINEQYCEALSGLTAESWNSRA